MCHGFSVQMMRWGSSVHIQNIGLVLVGWGFSVQIVHRQSMMTWGFSSQIVKICLVPMWWGFSVPMVCWQSIMRWGYSNRIFNMALLPVGWGFSVQMVCRPSMIAWGFSNQTHGLCQGIRNPTEWCYRMRHPFPKHKTPYFNIAQTPFTYMLVKNLSMMYRALWDRRHEGATGTS